MRPILSARSGSLAGSSFCHRRGIAASSSRLYYSAVSGRRRHVEAERRQVTVLFADMVGFTTFSERSGEEAAFTLMQSLQKLMEDSVRAQGGAVQGFTGD